MQLIIEVTDKKPFVIRLNISRKNYDLDLNIYRKINISIFFPYKYIENQILPCCKVDQGQLGSSFMQSW